jgi:hypothetical protein
MAGMSGKSSGRGIPGIGLPKSTIFSPSQRLQSMEIVIMLIDIWRSSDTDEMGNLE